jgi:hypothetical protein
MGLTNSWSPLGKRRVRMRMRTRERMKSMMMMRRRTRRMMKMKRKSSKGRSRARRTTSWRRREGGESGEQEEDEEENEKEEEAVEIFWDLHGLRQALPGVPPPRPWELLRMGLCEAFPRLFCVLPGVSQSHCLKIAQNGSWEFFSFIGLALVACSVVNPHRALFIPSPMALMLMYGT